MGTPPCPGPPCCVYHHLKTVSVTGDPVMEVSTLRKCLFSSCSWLCLEAWRPYLPSLTLGLPQPLLLSPSPSARPSTQPLSSWPPRPHPIHVPRPPLILVVASPQGLSSQTSCFLLSSQPHWLHGLPQGGLQSVLPCNLGTFSCILLFPGSPH